MKYLVLLFISLKLFALEPIVPTEDRRNYERVTELRKSNPKKALEFINDLKESYSPIFDYIAGGLLNEQNKTRDAELAFLRALKKEPLFTRAHKAIAMIYLRQEKFDQALKHLSLCIAQGGADSFCWRNLAFIHMKKENWQAAWFAFENVRLFEPENKGITKYFLDIRMRQKNYSEALNISREILKSEPENKSIWMTSINCLLNLEREPEALENFLLFAQVHDLDDSTKMNIASLAFNQEQYLTAIRFFNQINSELKNDAKLKKVYALVALEEYQQASSILSQLSKLEFSKNEMFYQLNAQVQLNIGNTKEAILAFEESLKYNTDNGATLLALGQLYEQEKDYNKALDYYSRCSGEFRDAAMLRSAGIYLLQKNYLQAIKTADIIVQSNADKVSKDTALSILKMANSIK